MVILAALGRGQRMTMDDVGFREGLEFIAPLMEQNARDLAYTTNTVIDSLATECAERQAMLDVVREQVFELLDQPYAPSAAAIERALWASETALRERAARILQQRGIHSSTHGRGDNQ